MEIRMEFYYNDELYRLNGSEFSRESIQALQKHFENKYSAFIEEINKQNGYLKVNIYHAENNGIHAEADVIGVSEELNNSISRHFGTDPFL